MAGLNRLTRVQIRRSAFIAAALIGFISPGGSSISQRIVEVNGLSENRVEGLSKARLLAAARAGGDYLLRMQRRDGSFVYSYDPITDHAGSRNNIVRHAGAAFALLDLYGATHDRRFLASGKKAVAFLRTRFRSRMAPKTLDHRVIYVLDFDGKAKLGANGLTLIALTRLIEFESNSNLLSDSKALARMILTMQREDGRFESYYRLHGDEPTGDVSLYYPGEAMLGLIRLYRINGDLRLLDAARRGADYLIASQKQMNQPPPDAWFSQALEALYGIDPKAAYADHAVALAEAMMAGQYVDSPDEYRGGFGPGVPRATPAASRAEGMLAAFRVAVSRNDPRAAGILEAIALSLRFQLSQQFTGATASPLKRPSRALGGFRESPIEARIRIDFVQHNVCSLLGAASDKVARFAGYD